METTAFKIRRCAWVTQFLYDRKRATLKQIDDAWVSSSEGDDRKEKPDRKTWYRCFARAYDIFGIMIEGGKRKDNYQWYIENPDSLEGKNIKQWMLSIFNYRNLIDKCMKIHYRFDLEPYPSENDRLKEIVEAMLENRQIQLFYQSYQNEKPSLSIVDPYYIKTYQRRFYVLCYNNTKECLRMYSFDRIVDMKILNSTFEMKTTLSAKEFFHDMFGVMLPNGDMNMERITVRAYGDEVSYLRDVPLHQSQVEINTTEKYSDFVLYMYPTRDFTGHVIHQEDRIEILKPEWLRNYMVEKYRNGLKRYGLTEE